jgi:hypothetical protein
MVRIRPFPIFARACFALFCLTALLPPLLSAAPRKTHSVVLGAARQVPYSKAGDPSGAQPGETALRLRPLFVDGVLKEWTTGDPHDITKRSFVVRRAICINDALPESSSAQSKPSDPKKSWVWQRGPWLLVDRVTGHITALKLPDYDPGASQPVWFRDLAAYCGVTASGKSLYAVVAQIGGRKPLLAKKLGEWDREHPVLPACAPAEWQRDPLAVTFHPSGRDAASFTLAPGSAVLVDESGDDAEPASTQTK